MTPDVGTLWKTARNFGVQFYEVVVVRDDGFIETVIRAGWPAEGIGEIAYLPKDDFGVKYVPA